MNSADFTQLSQRLFTTESAVVGGAFTDSRSLPVIPSRAVWLSLLLGEVGDHRCCDDCLTREITCKDAAGREYKKTQYYHKQVYAQLSEPQLSVILDVEPMRQGEEECAAALRQPAI